MLTSIDAACDFIAEWCGEQALHPGEFLATSFSIPSCVARLNARFGAYWQNPKRLSGSTLEDATPLLGLFGGQDHILHPGTYAKDASGVVRFVCENQGNWEYGFNPDQVDRLLVSGVWCDGSSGDFNSTWHHVQATTEDALICALLTNMCMQSDAEWFGDVPKLEAANVALWEHPAWSDFDGFWTNEEKTLICFSAWRVQRREPKSASGAVRPIRQR